MISQRLSRTIHVGGTFGGKFGMPMQSLVIDAPTPDVNAAPREKLDITFDSRGDRLLVLGAINGILKVLTLGLYGSWAKTEVRRRIWAATRLNGEPLAYTGTGKELFLGFLIVFAVVMLPALLGGVAVALLFPSKQALSIYQLALYVLFFFLIGNAMYRAQRYRLSRTQWRGIRGALTGSPNRYGWTYFWTIAAPLVAISLAAVVTAWATAPAVGGAIMLLGFMALLWVLPWRSNKLQGMMTRDTRFGDQPLTYTGTSKPLYKRYLFAWLGSSLILATAIAGTATYILQRDLYLDWLVLKTTPKLEDVLAIAAIWIATLIAIAVITSWYRANQMNHFARHTHFEGATFRGEAAGASLMWLVLSNWLLSLAGLFLALTIGGLLIKAFAAPSAAITPQPQMFAALAPLLFVLPPIIILTTLTSTFAQFRSARYFLSRLKLDGPLDLSKIMQNQNAGPRRGEGLAQVFDIDAF